MNRNSWKTSRSELTWGARPLIVGILNVTPDSFSDGGQYVNTAAALAHALEMEGDGADVIDVGGESTRPKAEPIKAIEELRRVMPVVEKLAGALRVPISIDTSKSEVALRALEAGAEIVNDISGGEWDEELWPVVAKKKAGYVLMHCKGRPVDGFRHEEYADVVREVTGYLEQRLGAAQKAGIERERIAVDPGFGFGKNAEENVILLANLDRLTALGRPILAGLSRKSFLKGEAGAEELAISTIAAQVQASLRGAAIWRVHDVKSAVAAAKTVEKLAKV